MPMPARYGSRSHKPRKSPTPSALPSAKVPTSRQYRIAFLYQRSIIQKSEVRSQKSEVRSQKSEVRSCKLHTRLRFARYGPLLRVKGMPSDADVITSDF